MNSRRMLLVMVFISSISVVAVVWLLSVTRFEQAKEIEQSHDQSRILGAAIEKADKELAAKRAEVERLRAQVREKEAHEEHVQQLVLQGEQALVKQDWSGAETAFLNALREAPKLQAALEGWIKTEVKKAAPAHSRVTSCNFSEPKSDNTRAVTISVSVSGADGKEFCDNFSVFYGQVGRVFEIPGWQGDPPPPPPLPPHSALREILSVRFSSLKVASSQASQQIPPTLDCVVKFDFATAAPSVSERSPPPPPPPVER